VAAVRLANDYQRETVLIIVVTTMVSIFAGLIGGAAPALALLWIPAMYYAFFRTPPWVLIRVLLVLGLFLEPKGMVPSHPLIENSGIEWTTPLEGANFIFYWSIKEVIYSVANFNTPLSVSFCFVGLIVVLVRTRKNKAPELKSRAGRVGTAAAVALMVGLGLVELWGAVRGGKIDVSFFQILQLMTRPIAAFLRSIRGAEDIRAFGTIIVTVACARALEIAFVYLTLCLPAGITPEACTTHGDSTTLAIAFLVLLADLIESQTKAARWRMLLVGGFLIMAMVMNNRRLVFLATAFGALGMYVSLPPSPARTKLNRRLIFVGPLIAMYMLIGEGQENPFFKPAKLFWSAISQKDNSSNSRDIENDNLLATLYEYPILGQGFGHEYIELHKEYEIGNFMPLYRYIPHNSVLWMWSAGGVIGFCAMWVPMLIGLMLAARAHRLSTTPILKAGALSSLGALLVVLTVDWGDVGAVSDMNVFGFAVAFATAVWVSAHAEVQAATA
jgi:hypothetical protein